MEAEHRRPATGSSGWLLYDGFRDWEASLKRAIVTALFMAGLANDHTRTVLDAAIRGKTDQCTLKFVKPEA